MSKCFDRGELNYLCMPHVIMLERLFAERPLKLYIATPFLGLCIRAHVVANAAIPRSASTRLRHHGKEFVQCIEFPAAEIAESDCLQNMPTAHVHSNLVWILSGIVPVPIMRVGGKQLSTQRYPG